MFKWQQKENFDKRKLGKLFQDIEQKHQHTHTYDKVDSLNLILFNQHIVFFMTI